MIVYLVISLPKLPYIHRICMVLASPIYSIYLVHAVLANPTHVPTLTWGRVPGEYKGRTTPRGGMAPPSPGVVRCCDAPCCGEACRLACAPCGLGGLNASRVCASAADGRERVGVPTPPPSPAACCPLPSSPLRSIPSCSSIPAVSPCTPAAAVAAAGGSPCTPAAAVAAAGGSRCTPATPAAAAAGGSPCTPATPAAAAAAAAGDRNGAAGIARLV